MEFRKIEDPAGYCGICRCNLKIKGSYCYEIEGDGLYCPECFPIRVTLIEAEKKLKEL